MTLRAGGGLLLAGFLLLGVIGWLDFFPRILVQEAEPEGFQPAVAEPEPTGDLAQLPWEEVWARSLAADSGNHPTWAEVQAAWAFRTPRAKAEFLQLLEGYGFRGAEALPALRAMLNDPDQEIRRAALRGLGRTETPEAESLLVGYAKDGVAIEESTEAALVLGQMQSPAVTGKLQGLLGQSRDPVLREHLVDALAGRPWEQTQAFFFSHLRNPNVAMEEKQNALAMLGMRDTAPAEILTRALGDAREEVRAGAYQGLAWRNDTAQAGKIRKALEQETDPGMRSMGYVAWGNQTDADRQEILAHFRKEKFPETRLRALHAWAMAFGKNPTSVEPFLPEAVKLLEEVAMTDPDPGERRVALQAIQATRSNQGREALQRIGATNSLKRVRELAINLSRSGYSNPPSP